MSTSESLDDIVIEPKVVRWTRLTFTAGLLFWPFFLLALTFVMGAPEPTGAAIAERRVLDACVWLYPVAVVAAWSLSKRAIRSGQSDPVCLLPWLLPAVLFAYWLIYFTL